MNSGRIYVTGSEIFCGMIDGSSAKLYPIPVGESIPSGIITMWSGSVDNIPSGWLLCDGSNGTPPLQDRFIVGAGSAYQVNDTGGAESVTLSSSQIPSHTHSVSLTAASNGSHTHNDTFAVSLSGLKTASAGAHTHTFSGSEAYVQIGSNSGFIKNYGSKITTSSSGAHTHTISGSASLTGSISSGGAHTHSVSGNTGSVGNSSSHENRPPYYALCFIMKE